MGYSPLLAIARRSLCPLVAFAAVLSAVAGTAQAQADDPGTITVVGDRAETAEKAANQATAATMRQPVDTPLPQRYAPVCLKLLGIAPAYGELIAEQIRTNARSVGRPIAAKGCQPNVLIVFSSDSRADLERLRKKEPAMFGSLTSAQADALLAGSGGAFVWHATEIRSRDGRPIPVAELSIPCTAFCPPRKIETGYNSQYSGGRLVSPIRNDINATIVVFDRDRANGKTVRQLADYATMRIFAPVRDFAEVPADVVPTILLLFTPGADAPDGLTEFDWAYLAAFYKLDRGAQPSAVHDATRRTMLDGTGQKLNEKAAQDGQGLTSPP